MKATTRAYLALGVICIVWGTTYTAIKFAIHDFPPFMMAGLRQTAGGLLLLGIAMAKRKIQIPDRQYVWKQSLTGIFTITGGNGLITWGMQFVSSGLSAIIGALTPVVVVLINLAWRGGERPSGQILAGVILGFAGLGVIFQNGWQDFLNPDYRLGILACFGSCFTWSLGTVMAKRYNAPGTSPLLNAGLQVTAGGLGALILSALFDPAWTNAPSPEAWLALGYLALIGSALAFTLYMFALQHLSATVSSLYTYINPIVAVLLGWLLLGEQMSASIALGMSVTITGIWLVNSGYAWAALKTGMKRGG